MTPTRSAPRTCVTVLSTVYCLSCLVTSSPAADTVHYLPAGRDQPRRLTGEVLDYTGRQLRLRMTGGREQSIPGERVVKVETSWGKSVEAADRAWEAADFSAAFDAYREGLRQEERVWAQRRLLGRMIWCLRHLGRTETAIESFLLLYRSDPTTPYFTAIPLAWGASQPTARLQSQLKDRLSEGEAVERLLAASWLLSGSARGEALQALEVLVVHEDPRIAFLARAQRWRTQVAQCTAADVTEWETTIDRMPQPLRGGPYFVVAQAWARLARPDRAAAAYLRLPILFAEHRELAAASLWRAAGEIAKQPQLGSPIPLYREILAKYPQSKEAEAARQKLPATESQE